MRYLVILLALSGCAPLLQPNDPTVPPSVMARIDQENARRVAAAEARADAQTARQDAARAAQVRANEERARAVTEQRTALEDAKAAAFACAADRECAAQPICQDKADLAEARATVAAIRAKQARFGVVNLHALSEAADDVIRLEGELTQGRASYKAAFGHEAVCP